MSRAVRTLGVDLGQRAYPIHIGPRLLSDAARLDAVLPDGPLLIVSNETVAPLHLARLRQGLAGRDPETLILPDGERHKTLATAERITDKLAQIGCTRDGAVVALGGGVISDLAGFAAACYMRGIAFVTCPTTLLAQVDASVGGKTGVNHPAGKNLIGAFHQPAGVFADTDTLATLPEREFRSGLAEVVKAALIADAAFFQWLEERADGLRARESDPVSEAIERACRIKAEIVAADERETGRRTLLNLGHTFAHAIETETGYERVLHGEAVAMGLAMAARLPAAGLSNASARRVEKLLERMGLPTRAPRDLEPGRLLERMRLDKKARAGRLRLVLLEEIGRAAVLDDVPDRAVLDALAARA